MQDSSVLVEIARVSPLHAKAAFLGLFRNTPFISAWCSFSIAQLLKCVLTYHKTGKWDWSRLWGAGGFPSSHTALVSGLAMSVCMKEGPDSTAFAITVVVAAITAYDATGIRLQSGRQASVLNAIVVQLPPEHPVQEHEHAGRLRDQLGHTPIEVVAGALLGIIVAVLVQSIASIGHSGSPSGR